MIKILLDTNAFTAFMNGDQVVFDSLIEAETVYISTIVAGELFAGFNGGTSYSKNVEDLRLFLQKEGVTIIDVTLATSELFGEIKAELRKKGKMIPLNDIWIAAHAIETGSKLVTYDSHFTHIQGLRMWKKLKD